MKPKIKFLPLEKTKQKFLALFYLQIVRVIMTSKTPHLIFGCANAGWGIICALMAANCLRITAVAKTNNVRNLALGLFMIYTIAGITSGTAAIQKFKYASKLPKSGGREP